MYMYLSKCYAGNLCWKYKHVHAVKFTFSNSVPVQIAKSKIVIIYYCVYIQLYTCITQLCTIYSFVVNM